MDDIEHIWQQNEGGDDMLNRLLQQNDFQHFHSRLPLQKLRTNLMISIAWGIAITAAYIWLLFKVYIWQVDAALVVLILFNGWIITDSWRLYKKIPASIIPSNSLKDELQNHCAGFQKWWSIQQKISLLVYPVAVAGGFVLGGVLGSGKTVEAFLYNSRMLLFLAITIVVLVPMCYYGARWLFRLAYGKHLKQLQSLISELSEQ